MKHIICPCCSHKFEAKEGLYALINEAFKEYDEEELTTKEIAEFIGYTNGSASQALNRMYNEGRINRRTMGGIKNSGKSYLFSKVIIDNVYYQ